MRAATPMFVLLDILTVSTETVVSGRVFRFLKCNRGSELWKHNLFKPESDTSDDKMLIVYCQPVLTEY